MGFKNDTKIAPEHEIEDIEFGEPRKPSSDEIPEDEPPFEHHDIRTTPISLPESKKARASKLQKELSALYTMIGTGIFPLDQQVGGIIIQQSESCASALSDLAAQNPRVRRALENLLTAGAYTAVISAHLPIAVMIATKYIPPVRDNYGKLIDQMNGKAA